MRRTSAGAVKTAAGATAVILPPLAMTDMPSTKRSASASNTFTLSNTTAARAASETNRAPIARVAAIIPSSCTLRSVGRCCS